MRIVTEVMDRLLGATDRMTVPPAPEIHMLNPNSH